MMKVDRLIARSKDWLPPKKATDMLLLLTKIFIPVKRQKFVDFMKLVTKGFALEICSL